MYDPAAVALRHVLFQTVRSSACRCRLKSVSCVARYGLYLQSVFVRGCGAPVGSIERALRGVWAKLVFRLFDYILIVLVGAGLMAAFLVWLASESLDRTRGSQAPDTHTLSRNN
jgi:hypothetical protein